MPKTNNDFTVEDYDNRLVEDGVGFGYVYFTDGTRVGWTDNEGPWECNRNASWGPTTQKHLRLAEEFLRERGLLKK